MSFFNIIVKNFITYFILIIIFLLNLKLLHFNKILHSFKNSSFDDSCKTVPQVKFTERTGILTRTGIMITLVYKALSCCNSAVNT